MNRNIVARGREKFRCEVILTARLMVRWKLGDGDQAWALIKNYFGVRRKSANIAFIKNMVQEMKLISWIWQRDAKVFRNEMSACDCDCASVWCVMYVRLMKMLMEKVKLNLY